MQDKTPRYITTTLPYVNADPHIGFAAEIVAADALARYWRLLGHDVFFNTGTDEHGQKIAEKADKEGRAREEYVAHFAGEFAKLKDQLGLDYTNFIRTSNADHKKAAQELWRRCALKGDIEKRKYKGLYCVGDEMFLKDSDLVDGRCPNHPNMDPIEIEEENYFFRASKYRDYLVNEYLSRPGVVVPEWRRQEAISFASSLEDFSISRERSRLDWGVPVPGDDNQVMYVWFDALTNYISTLGWPDDKEGNYKKFWNDGETYQMAGKDQVRFQSIMWQAMLKSADLAPTDTVIYHGFINIGGHKMSKSLGNVISPNDLVARYGTEATRYLLLRHVHPFDDTDITWERLDEWYTAGLVNGLGNFTSRIMKMAEDNLDGPVSTLDEGEELLPYSENFDSFNLALVMDNVWHRIGMFDSVIQKEQPFKAIKIESEKERAVKSIESLVRSLFLIASSIKPSMPETSKIILDAIKENKKPENLFPRLT